MNELTKDQALAIAQSECWREWNYRERAQFVFAAGRLCMPFPVFHEALEKALKRPVYTHEIGLDWRGLLRELNGDRRPPTLNEIINLIPENKRIIILRANDPDLSIGEFPE